MEQKFIIHIISIAAMIALVTSCASGKDLFYLMMQTLVSTSMSFSGKKHPEIENWMM